MKQLFLVTKVLGKLHDFFLWTFFLYMCACLFFNLVIYFFVIKLFDWNDKIFRVNKSGFECIVFVNKNGCSSDKH